MLVLSQSVNKHGHHRQFLFLIQSETRIACGGHVCKWIGNEMSNLYRGPSIDASYQVSVHLAEGFQRRILKCEKLTDDIWAVLYKDWSFRLDPLTNMATTDNSCFWLANFLTIFIENRPYMLPTKFRFIWPNGFRGEEFKKSANQKQESPVAAPIQKNLLLWNRLAKWTETC
jgi:hypothetical protein